MRTRWRPDQRLENLRGLATIGPSICFRSTLRSRGGRYPAYLGTGRLRCKGCRRGRPRRPENLKSNRSGTELTRSSRSLAIPSIGKKLRRYHTFEATDCSARSRTRTGDSSESADILCGEGRSIGFSTCSRSRLRPKAASRRKGSQLPYRRWPSDRKHLIGWRRTIAACTARNGMNEGDNKSERQTPDYTTPHAASLNNVVRTTLPPQALGVSLHTRATDGTADADDTRREAHIQEVEYGPRDPRGGTIEASPRWLEPSGRQTLLKAELAAQIRCR